MAIPFHRRILPWIFAIVFIAVAPAVIFYTSGYRWNAKKGRVERNGTVILDSTPREARILMDGILVGKTPLTLQDVSPGLHRFTIAANGFFPWEKTFDVQPERVTFAHSVWLWKTSDLRLRESRTTIGLTASDDERWHIEFENGTTTVARITDTLRDEGTRISFARRLSPLIRSQWSPNHRYVLVESLGSPSMIMDVQNRRPPMELPQATYRWEDTRLIGVATSVQYHIDVSSSRITKNPLPQNTVDLFERAELRHTTSSAGRVYVPKPSDPRGYVLPNGSWLFWERTPSRLLFHEDGRWLSFHASNGTAVVREARGDFLRPHRSRSGDRFLFLHGGEVWLWNLLDDPELLYRQSEPIVAAAWHHKGDDIFFATQTAVFSLNLDPRDGRRITSLATLDRIADILAFKNNLLITGMKNGTHGVWEMQVE